MIRAINAVLIHTQDIDRLISFYRDSVGIPLEVSDHGGRRHAEAEIGGTHFAIFGGGPPPMERGSITFSLEVEDIDRAHADLALRGVEFEHPPREMPFGGVLAPFRDPDGNGVCLMVWQSDRGGGS